MPDLTLTTSRVIKAPPKAIYDAWLDPAHLARFMLPGAGSKVPHVATDPRVGGRFEIVMQDEGEPVPHAGTYLTLTPHSCIVFTWESPYSTVPGSNVTVEMIPVDGGTEVRLTHVKFPTESSRDGHAKGWAAILGALQALWP